MHYSINFFVEYSVDFYTQAIRQALSKIMETMGCSKLFESSFFAFVLVFFLT